MKQFSIFLAALTLLSLPSCQITKTYYSKDNKDWKQDATPDTGQLLYSVYLIGDVGEPSADAQEPSLKLLQAHLKQAGNKSSVVFLGDNIYNEGLPDSSEHDRKEMEAKINAQLDILEGYAGRPFFVAGNHDWGYNLSEGHVERVQREDQYIERYLNRTGVFFPKNGCPGPEVLELTDSLALLLMDSQWWLQTDVRPDCPNKTEETFMKQLAQAVQQHKDKHIIIAAHHPLISSGPHGGYTGWKPHIFPFTIIKHHLYIPFPILGSFYSLVRAVGISKQDIRNKTYKKYIAGVKQATEGHGQVVFAAGHEHTLEYFKINKGLHQVVSGAGSKRSEIKKTKQLGFGAHSKGFAVLNYYKDGNVWLEFWKPLNDGAQGELLFRTNLYN
ncbi:MAG: metallophosphoesterase [Chitinophagales bacterium]|nr:metallophosphoesterase [Chitinophagales bacterium]